MQIDKISKQHANSFNKEKTLLYKLMLKLNCLATTMRTKFSH